MGNLAQIDQLILSGLGNKRELPYWRIIMTDPVSAITNMVYRNLTIRLYTKLLKYILTDQIIYQRLRTLLLADNSWRQNEEKHSILPTIKEIVHEKSQKCL